MKRIFAIALTGLLLTTALAPPASALEYTFEPESKSDYYGSTSYEDIYGSQYNYGGTNVIDFYDPTTVDYTPSTAPTFAPAADTSNSGLFVPTYDTTVSYPDLWGSAAVQQVSYTDPATLTRSDGSIGTLSIPSLGISMKVYEGTTSASMKKGVGHFSETSGWYGNIGLAGHNRNAAYVIGSIKDLKIGDTITYTTSLGTRTYHVSFVGNISSTDWSYLQGTADNRITLITCLANQPSLRVCVQAKEA